MTRSRLSIAIFVLVLATALLHRAAFATSNRADCAEKANSRPCLSDQAQRPFASLQAKIEALSHTYPSAAPAPVRDATAQIEALRGTYPAAASAPAASLAAKIEALSHTYPSAAPAPSRDLAAQIEALSATYPAANELSPAELQYHRESTARMDLPWPMGYAAPAARELSVAEQYYRATMSHLVTAAPAASVKSPIDTLTSMELENHRGTAEHTDVP